MSECKEIVAMLSEYLDRNLPPETCAVIELHLSSCPECGATAESLRGTVNLCKQLRAESKPGPLPAGKHHEMRQAFQRALEEMRGGS